MILHGRRLTVTFVGWAGAVGTTVLVVASRGDLLVLAAATPLIAFFVLAALLASPTHRADLERRRTTIRAARAMARLLQEAARTDDRAGFADRVALALVEVLELRGCWYEASTVPGDLPEITADGEVTAHVQRRVGAGLALPPLVVILVPGPDGHPAGFVLEADPAVGLSMERRLIAVAMAQTVALTGNRRPAPGGRR